MGIHKEIRNLFGSSVQNYIISARTAQGYEQFKISTPKERQAIISEWSIHKNELLTAHHKAREEEALDSHASPSGFAQTRHLTFDERKKLAAERKAKKDAEKDMEKSERPKKCPFCAKTTPHYHDENVPHPSMPDHSLADADHDEFERAIKESVAATSKGDPEEDRMIERAIRASVLELQNAQGSISEKHALEHAIQASAKSSGAASGATRGSLDDAEHEANFQRSLKASLQDAEDGAHMDVDTDDDEDMKRAIEASRLHKDNTAISSKELTEEEIVMEYVKKQSLVEEEHRKAALEKTNSSTSTGGNNDAHDGDDDEDFEKAIAASLKDQH